MKKKSKKKELFDPLKDVDIPTFDPLAVGSAPPKKQNQKTEPNGSVCRNDGQKITKAEAEVLGMFLSSDLTVAQVAARRGCSKTYIRKIKRKLEKLGLINKQFRPPQRSRGDYGTSGTKIIKKDKRIHAQKFRIELIKPIEKKYLNEHVKKITWSDGNNIQCFQKVICIQSYDKGFHGATEEEALDVSMIYWYKFFTILENDFGVKILKDRRQNITMTYLEWATEDCDLSKECEKKGDRIRLFAKDGKLRYTTDKSFLYEREAHHHVKGKEDSETGNRFIEDMLDHPEMPKFSELTTIVKDIADQIKNNVKVNSETATGLGTVVEILKLQNKPEPSNKKTPLEKADYIG